METVGLVVVVALLCLFHIVYVIFESEQGLSAKIGPGVSNKGKYVGLIKVCTLLVNR